MISATPRIPDQSDQLFRRCRPADAGRGYAIVVARSDDGRALETVCVLDRDAFGAASLERPALVRMSARRWRLYVSCSTPGSKHWRVAALDAAEPPSSIRMHE
jgi:hypothetical protein